MKLKLTNSEVNILAKLTERYYELLDQQSLTEKDLEKKNEIEMHKNNLNIIYKKLTGVNNG